jgi:hypothetical protein
MGCATRLGKTQAGGDRSSKSPVTLRHDRAIRDQMGLAIRSIGRIWSHQPYGFDDDDFLW